MAISRVPGFSLLSDLDRQGVDLEFTTGGNALVYMDFANFRLGINENNPAESLHVVGNIVVTDSMLGASNTSQNLGSDSVWWNNIYAANAVISDIQSGTIYGTLTNPTQPNITSVGNLATLTVNGELFAGNITTANIAGNVTTGYQPYITELESVEIHNLTTTGNISFSGNTVTDTINANVIYEFGFRVLTSNSNIVVSGDVVGFGNNSNIVLTLVDTGAIAGVYGAGDDEFADRIPKITVDAKGRITNIANVLLTQVGNVSFTDTTISTSSNITLAPQNGFIFANNATITDVANPVNLQDVVTLDYLNNQLSGSANLIIVDDSSLTLWDDGINPGALELILDGNVAFNITETFAAFNVNTVNIGTLQFSGNTISSPGNITLNAQGTGIVQISGADAFGLPYGNTAARPAAPEEGYFRFNTDFNDIEWYNGTMWKTTQTAVISEIITPDGTANAFTIGQSVDSEESLLVVINGTLQQPVTAYTVSGNVVTFSETPLTTDIIEVRTISQNLATVTSAATQLIVGSSSVIPNGSDVEITGNLIPSANVTYSLGDSTHWWNDLWISGNTIFIGGTTLSVVNGNLNVGGEPITAPSTYGNTNVAAFLSNNSIGPYGNTNVAAYLTTHEGSIGGNISSTSANIAGDLRASQLGLGKDPAETLDVYGVADASISVTSAVNNNYVYYGCDFGTMQINGDYSGLEMNSYTYPPFIQLKGPGNVTIGHPNINLRTINTAPESYTYISGGREATVGAHVRFINENANVFATSRSALAFYTSNSSAYLTEQVRITSNGDVGIGNSTPSAKLHVAGNVIATNNIGIGITPAANLHVYSAGFVTLLNESDTNSALQLRAYSAGNSPEIDFVRTRGTKASPTAVGTGDELYHIYGYGYGGSTYNRLTDIMSGVSTYVSDTNISSYLAFSTCNASNNVTERIRIVSTGRVGVGTTSPLANLHVIGNAIISTTLAVTGNLTVQSDITGYDKFTFLATQGNIIGKESQSIRFPSQGIDIVTVSGTNVNINTGNTGTLAVTGSINTTGRLYVSGLTDVETILERANISAAAATGTVNADILDNAVMFFTGNATANWTYNVRGNATTRFDTVVSTGQSVSLAFLATVGASSYVQSNFTIDSSNVTVRWQGNAPPTTSTLNSIQLYTFTIIKRAANTYTALGSVISYV